MLSLQSVRQENPSAAATLATAPLVDEQTSSDAAALLANTTPNTFSDVQNLDMYLVNHNEFAANRGMQGMLPYVRLVGHDSSSLDDNE